MEALARATEMPSLMVPHVEDSLHTVATLYCRCAVEGCFPLCLRSSYLATFDYSCAVLTDSLRAKTAKSLPAASGALPYQIAMLQDYQLNSLAASINDSESIAMQWHQ